MENKCERCVIGTITLMRDATAEELTIADAITVKVFDDDLFGIMDLLEAAVRGVTIMKGRKVIAYSPNNHCPKCGWAVPWEVYMRDLLRFGDVFHERPGYERCAGGCGEVLELKAGTTHTVTRIIDEHYCGKCFYEGAAHPRWKDDKPAELERDYVQTRRGDRFRRDDKSEAGA